MADYAGAVGAMKQRLVENWTATRIIGKNETPADPWPPTVSDPDAPAFPRPAPWVMFEIFGGGSSLVGAATPGDHAWLYEGLILVHVFVPVGSGTDWSYQNAVAIGEIFRAKVFYDDVTPGCYVRTWAPYVDQGGISDDDGTVFRNTMSCPFEYWHRG